MAEPVLETTSFESGASRTNTVITPPSGIADDDILYVCMYTETELPGTPDGTWTEIHSVLATTSVFRLTCWWKRASSESGDYTFTHSNIWSNAHICRISGCITTGSPLNAQDIGASSTQTATGDPRSVTTTVAECLLIYTLANYDNGTHTPPSGFTERIDNSSGTGTAEMDLPTASTSGPHSGSTSGTNYNVASLIALRPPAAGGLSMPVAMHNYRRRRVNRVPDEETRLRKLFGFSSARRFHREIGSKLWTPNRRIILSTEKA